MGLVVQVAIVVQGEDGGTLVSVGRTESVLPMTPGMTELADATAERGRRLMREAGDEFDRQMEHLKSLLEGR